MFLLPLSLHGSVMSTDRLNRPLDDRQNVWNGRTNHDSRVPSNYDAGSSLVSLVSEERMESRVVDYDWIDVFFGGRGGTTWGRSF